MAGIVEAWFRGTGFALLLALRGPDAIAAEETPGQKADAERPEGSYYLLRSDRRRCASPLCGGFWIEAVNREHTRCVDGDRREACYVAEVDWTAIGPDGGEGAMLVQGRQHPKDHAGFGPLAVLVAEKAYRPVTDGKARGRWYALGHSGVVCVTHPCFAIDERLLNGADEQTISGVDLDGVGAAPEDVEVAGRSLARGELIAVGENVPMPDQGPAGAGITMVASQFFLRVGGEGK